MTQECWEYNSKKMINKSSYATTTKNAYRNLVKCNIIEIKPTHGYQYSQ